MLTGIEPCTLITIGLVLVNSASAVNSKYQSNAHKFDIMYVVFYATNGNAQLDFGVQLYGRQMRKSH